MVAKMSSLVGEPVWEEKMAWARSWKRSLLQCYAVNALLRGISGLTLGCRGVASHCVCTLTNVSSQVCVEWESKYWHFQEVWTSHDFGAQRKSADRLVDDSSTPEM